MHGRFAAPLASDDVQRFQHLFREFQDPAQQSAIQVHPRLVAVGFVGRQQGPSTQAPQDLRIALRLEVRLRSSAEHAFFGEARREALGIQTEIPVEI